MVKNTEHVMSVFYADPGPKISQVKKTFLPVRMQGKCAVINNAAFVGKLDFFNLL